MNPQTSTTKDPISLVATTAYNRDLLAHVTPAKYRADVDGLRALAVSLVVLYHAFPTLVPGGFIGVDIFFVISGFLISGIIFEKTQRGTFSFTDFYVRRIRRIFPSLTLVLFATLLFGWFSLLPDELTRLGKHVYQGALFIANFTLFKEAGYFDPSAELKPLLHLWSLGIEEQFYIVFPLLVWLLAWMSRKWQQGKQHATNPSTHGSLWLVAILLLGSFAWNLLTLTRDPVFTFYMPVTRFWELLMGSVLAWVTLNVSGFKSEFQAKPTVLNHALSTLGVVTLGVGLYVIDTAKPFPGVYALFPLLGTTCLIAAGEQAWINRRILAQPWVVFLGMVSYPLYLWHWPLLSYARIVNAGEVAVGLRVMLVALGVFLAWLTHAYWERPFRFGKTKVVLRVGVLVSLMVLVAVAGRVIYKSDPTTEYLWVPRKGVDLTVSQSQAWMQSQDGWLFLGNAYDRSVDKARGLKQPEFKTIEQLATQLKSVMAVVDPVRTQVVFMMGPNKETVYPERYPYQQPWFVSEGYQSRQYYGAKALKLLEGFHIPNIPIIDPTPELWAAKAGLAASESLYYRTDSHWNVRGAYVGYSGVMRQFGLKPIEARFQPLPFEEGDIAEMIGKKSILNAEEGDNWKPEFTHPSAMERIVDTQAKKTPYGDVGVVKNSQAPYQKVIWVIGDSFTRGMRPLLEQSFAEVHYLGHISDLLLNQGQPVLLEKFKALPAPDLILFIRVERTL